MLIEKVRELLILQEELRDQYGIIDTSNNVITGRDVQVSDFQKLNALSEGNVLLSVREDDDYPYEYYFHIDDIKFFTLATEEEYKKATAPTVTKKSNDSV